MNKCIVLNCFPMPIDISLLDDGEAMKESIWLNCTNYVETIHTVNSNYSELKRDWTLCDPRHRTSSAYTRTHSIVRKSSQISSNNLTQTHVIAYAQPLYPIAKYM